MNSFATRFLQTCTVLLIGSTVLFGQHRGDNLAFQGLADKNEGGIRSMAMGGAYTSMYGDLSSLFSNPAGLANLSKFQISVSANSYSSEVWENQVYRTNRLQVTLPFYLEGLYIPDPANNGIIDSDLALDSAYVVNPPAMGQVPTSKEAAEWINKQNGSGFNAIALAYPLEFMGQHLVVAGSYALHNQVLDFDRNDTYLDPHIGTAIYDGFTDRVDGSDTLIVNWYRFLRKRSGKIHNAKFALAYQLNKSLNLSASLNYLTGASTDEQQLNKVGYFGLLDENEFYFSYDTLNYLSKGESEYKQINFELGLQYRINALSIGIHFVTPSTLQRKWTYTASILDTSGTSEQKTSGTDEMALPSKLNLGMSFRPAKAFTFSIDYGYTAYSKATFDLASQDTTHRGWNDQQAIRVGMKVDVTNYLSFMGGYKNVSQVFVPDGAPFKSRGPEAESWTMGLSLGLFNFGWIEIAYEMRSLTYFDEYYSNTNYTTNNYNNFAFGYAYKF